MKHFNKLTQKRIPVIKSPVLFRILLPIILSAGVCVNAQQAVSSSGGNAKGTSGSASYSAGIVAYSCITSPNGSVTMGVQQTFEISTISGIEKASGINLECAVYPNPATEYVMLKVENYETDNLNYRLNDLNGKLIANGYPQNNETQIHLGYLKTGTYILKIFDKELEIKSFKIIKK